jgi:hypothetical protein
MKEWVVKTHIGDFRTVAPTAKKAIANIRFRLFGRGCGVSTAYWEAKEA